LTDTELLLRARGGDEPAFRSLLGRHEGRITFVVSKYGGKGLAKEDYEQEALFGFYKAVNDYRSGNGASFATFASLCIERQVITALKTAGRNKHIPLNEAASLERPTGEQGMALGERLADRRSVNPDPVEAVLHAETLAECSRAVRERLSDLECACFSRWLDGLDYNQVADRLGITAKAVDNALGRVHRKLAEDGRAPSGYACPTCGGSTVKRKQGRGRPPRCVVCRTSPPSYVAVAA
jgi:RNA polymerase sporulation-specific sigma factor